MMTEDTSWVKLYRKTLDSDMYRDLNAVQRDVMFSLLMMVNSKPKQWMYKGKVYTAQPGQVVTSLESIRKKCAKGTSIQNVRTALHKLENWHFLTNVSTRTGRLITLVNWEVYQSNPKENKNDQQSTNKALTPNKNIRINTIKHMYQNAQNEHVQNNQNDKDHSSVSTPERSMYTNDFEKFWKSYPRKIGKKRAYSLWTRRINYFKPELRASPAELIQACENYAMQCEKAGTEKKYIKHPSTFLSDKLDYLDYITEEELTKPAQNKEADMLDKEIENQRRVTAWLNSGRGLEEDHDIEDFREWTERGGKEGELPYRRSRESAGGGCSTR